MKKLLGTLKHSRVFAPGWAIVGVPIGAVLALWSHLARRTSRVREHGAGATYAGPAVYVHWHCYIPGLLPEHGRRHLWMMVSGAPYMAPIALWCRLLGVRMVRGASGERGRAALEMLAKHLASGDSAVLAVDGPAGPPKVAKPGCIELARLARAPIIPVAYRSRRGFIVRRRWDESRLVRPCDEMDVVYGAPVTVSQDMPMDVERARVEAALQEVEQQLGP